MRQSHKTILLWVLLILMFLSVYNLFQGQKSDDQKVSFSDFIARVDKEPQHIKKVIIKTAGSQGAPAEFSGEWTDATGATKKFITTGIVGEQTLTKLQNSHIPFEVQRENENPFWQSFVISWLPMIFLFLIFFLFMRQLQSGGGKAMSFGKSKAKLLSDHQNKVTFNDVAGIEEAKDEVEEIIAFLKDPKKFTKLGGRIPKGVLMMGPPGTGKTLLARAIAGEAGVPFFSISGSDFVEMFVGVGASRVRDLFEQGKKNAPCIIFIDEIDAVGRHRGAGLGGGHDEREQTLNQLLVEMDGFESNEGVILIAATNRPDVKGRLGILKVHTKRVPLATDVELEVIARGTPGFSGADLENLVNEAALAAARIDKDKVDMLDFELAKDKVLMGSERKSMIISDREKRTTAHHEAGHALVAKMLPGADPVHKVTIIPRGRALGVTQQLPTEDRLNLTREFAKNQIAILMGGRLAEEIIFGEANVTTGAGNDIEVATDLARKMVCEWGMSEKMGPLTFGKKEEQIFLGREFAQHQDYSEQTAIDIDAEVKRIVLENYERARGILLANLDKLKAIAEALLEHETLDAEDIDRLLAGQGIERKPPAPPLPVEAKEAKKEKRPSLFAPRPTLKPDPEKA
ncbi:MAG TPA: AAA family ATPase [Polyangia bacterium]|nr:AAA family ATPase [Polyangia bacterium]